MQKRIAGGWTHSTTGAFKGWVSPSYLHLSYFAGIRFGYDLDHTRKPGGIEIL
jgi:hypothetical protein